MHDCSARRARDTQCATHVPSTHLLCVFLLLQDVSLLDLSSGSLLGSIAAGNEELEDQFSSFDVDPSERNLVTISRRSLLMKVWDIAECRELSSWKCAHQLPVLDVAYSPTGMEVASCSADKSIVVYSVKRSGVITHRFAASSTKPGHKSRVVHIFWHPSPKRMVRHRECEWTTVTTTTKRQTACGAHEKCMRYDVSLFLAFLGADFLRRGWRDAHLEAER